MKIYIINKSFKRKKNIIDKWGLEHDQNALMALIIKNNRLEIFKRDEPNLGNFWIDFAHKKLIYRIQSQVLKKEAIAKAIGIKKNNYLNVVDATAGLGKDALVLTALGCKVCMIERNPIVAALLEDALKRNYPYNNINLLLKEKMSLIYASSLSILKKLKYKPDVTYLDPMYPITKKNMVKKDMYFLRLLIGEDKDSGDLLTLARKCSKKRVIVKRQLYAPYLSGIKTKNAIISKKHRFDIYSPL
ncbi:class I SAM-dependent methyltransferase [Buchnera aphidicola]|uniref:class I SAM-dependent methyltransferase n=1 Tax=Buchnera aphidicola TaxID=9 RepID=UPI0034642CFE